MGLVCGRAGNLTAENGGFRPGQCAPAVAKCGTAATLQTGKATRGRAAGGRSGSTLQGSAGRGVKGALDPPEQLLTTFRTRLMVKFGGHLPTLPAF
jgi:hypothetical protein